MAVSDARRVMFVFGTRPEAIKVAPVVLAMHESPLEPFVVVTAQHREMLDSVLTTFGIVPDVDLDILVGGQTLTDVSVRVLSGLTPVLEAARPDVVVVQGDTTTTLMGALAAFYSRVPVVHMEAGLRTGDPSSPYPEEINRRLTTQLASLHLPPTPAARDNLLADGVHRSSIIVTGNTVIDALRLAVAQRAPYDDPVLEQVDRSGDRVVLVTAHRRESWAGGMSSIGRAIAELARSAPDVRFVLPLHRNPVVRDALLAEVGGLDSIVLTEPLPYASFARLLARADLVLTDSGGVQEEAPSLGTPVLVLRDTTERPEAVAAGTVRLVGTDTERIVSAAGELLYDETARRAMARAVNPYGDGQASGRTVAAIGHHLGLQARPAEFGGGCRGDLRVHRHRDVRVVHAPAGRVLEAAGQGVID